jgi:peptidoglycan-associated lipoprotein
MKLKSVFLMMVMSCFVMACSSTKLDTPVEDKQATVVDGSDLNNGNNSGQMNNANSSVQSMDLNAANNGSAGPANVSKIIYFDYDSYQVRPEYVSVLEAHARFLSANKARKASLEGHTDSSGGREYNLALGQKRADAVRRSLTMMGVSDSQIESVSFGKEKLADPGNGEAAMAKNRRAEIFYR